VAQENSNGWKGWALAALTGLLVGGGFGGIIGSNAAATVEARVNQRVNKVEVGEQKNFDIIIQMSERLVRMEVMLERIEKEEVR